MSVIVKLSKFLLSRSATGTVLQVMQCLSHDVVRAKLVFVKFRKHKIVKKCSYCSLFSMPSQKILFYCKLFLELIYVNFR